MQLAPEEVIFAIAMSDLHIDINGTDEEEKCSDFGGSWWFLTCESDDHYADIVKQIVSICSFQQVRLLCLMEGGRNRDKGTVIIRATPKCKDILQRAIRFMGRFEFLGDFPIYSNPDTTLKAFQALDFGIAHETGRKVTLKCYQSRNCFLQDVRSRALESLVLLDAMPHIGFRLIF